MKLPRTTHTEYPWRIHEFARDFRVEDAWSYRTPGAGPADFPRMLAASASGAGVDSQSLPVRFLFAVRWKLGALFGWDRDGESLGKRVRSLSERLPDDLRATVDPSVDDGTPFTPVYELGDECVRE